MNTFIKLCCFLFFCLGAWGGEFEAIIEPILSNASIVSTQQIKIPGYPNAYNPSLIPYRNGYLLSFRFRSGCPKTVDNRLRKNLSFIGVAKLDKNFKVSEKTVQLLNIVSYAPRFSLTAEDARLLNVGSRIFIFFNDRPPLGSPGTFAMYFGELVEEQGMFVLKGDAKLLDYPHAIGVEKNWPPFVSGDRLYMVYSGEPRIILEVDLNTGKCNEVARTMVDWDWNLGEIRGGTPAYLVNDSFLTFFHSCSKERIYVMGAYIFDREPPFSVRAMTPVPLGDLSYYTEDNSSKVVFPGGMVVQGDRILVAWGKGDKQVFITTFNTGKLLASMQKKY